MRVSHLELYNEQLKDLLSPEYIDLRAYEEKYKGTFVQGLENNVVINEQGVFAVFEKSFLNLKIADTNMKKAFSRSYSIFCITIHIKESTSRGPIYFAVEC